MQHRDINLLPHVGCVTHVWFCGGTRSSHRMCRTCSMAEPRHTQIADPHFSYDGMISINAGIIQSMQPVQ